MSSVIKWSLAWLALTLAITIAGGVTGALLFVAGGWVFGYDLEIQQLLLNGLKDGGFYAFIWAPGVSFVICIILIRNNSVKNADNLS